jgi:hypothetical protein
MSDGVKIPKEDKAQYDILLKCADQQQTLLIRCTDKRTKKPCTLLAVYHVNDNGSHDIFPIARMITSEEFDQYEPPSGSTEIKA